ncbi:FMN-binding protein [Rhodoferax sediminis]|uniref:FMN-binding protein n=1 Tax=Rhodoferax sediminis TaxID=2509614 RepID=A0A515DC38_9BURK|nr:FMN-binding protein [Rhodoferax sediminis]QDL37984.1 FMN-binding protein [Rhodoferax sediminis]
MQKNVLALAPHALTATLLIVGLGASGSAFAVDYLTAAQARQLLFPAATQWQDKDYALSAEQLQAVARAGHVAARSAGWHLVHAFDAQHKYLGSMVVDHVVGKFELISYAVGVDAAGAIAGVEVLSYRESHGSEIRLPAWRRQFAGKTVAQPIEIGDDIALISGATLSCTHVTDGVRRIVAVLSVLREGGLLPA